MNRGKYTVENRLNIDCISSFRILLILDSLDTCNIKKYICKKYVNVYVKKHMLKNVYVKIYTCNIKTYQKANGLE